MTRPIYIAAALILGLSCALHAGETHPPKVTTVTACGEAATGEPNAKDKAVADALRNAVMAGIGTYVDSTTLGENYEVVKDDILLKSSGFATLDKIESTSISDGVIRVKISASVSNVPLVEKLKGLGLTHEWKIGVYIPESGSGVAKSSSSVETAVIQQLMKSGFRVLDESQRRQLQEDESASRAIEGNAEALKSIKREYGADIFITGEASAEYVDQAEEGGVNLFRSRGDIEIKAYYTDTAELLSATDTFADGLDQTKNLSCKQCLKNLGKEAGRAITEDILIAPAELTPFVTIKITNLKSMTDASSIQSALKSLPGVTRVKQDRYTSGVLELNVYVKAEYRDELPEKFEQCATAKKMGLVINTWSKSYVQGRVARS